MMSSAVSGSSQRFSVSHRPNPTALSVPSPSKRGLSLIAKLWFTAVDHPTALTHKVLWVSKHMLERLVTLGTWPGHENIPGCRYIYCRYKLKTCCKVDIKADYCTKDNWICMSDSNSEKSNQFNVNFQRTIPFHKSFDHFQLLYELKGRALPQLCLFQWVKH